MPKKGPGLKININAETAPPAPVAAPRNLDKSTTITIEDRTVAVAADDLEVISELGRGAYGVVEKMRHRPSGTIMAVKRIPATDNYIEQKRVLMDLDISMRSANCPFTVQFYGALFREGDVWICMEVMDISLDKLYPAVFRQNNTGIPEDILSKITFAVVKALQYLHTELKVIHRDVKPSNILISRDGRIKLCDFGISGYLQNSVAKTIDVGCKPYMAPERIDVMGDTSNYDVRSDVWSLGISLVELATANFPYERWGTPFDQLKQVVTGDPPSLPNDMGYSPEIQDFIRQCLKKCYTDRPSYSVLLQHPFISTAEASCRESCKWDDVALFVTRVLDSLC
ncbi:Dual specificity mitogen-activated protein kinase kinase 6 [Orchesella cincta]|uniref:mitogen-activated protein kinase kinase n=1 Tax=Orchesella cincta TaxID=48709 RepID=A0A1D2MGN2_ORCCI|nr:Dual specificity mitogen-activated protein kinase kinase 6 [Orchesella cincta]